CIRPRSPERWPNWPALRGPDPDEGAMFELSLLDHLRLTFGHVVSRQHVHTRLASSRARWSQRLRAGEAVSIAGVAVLAACAALGRGRAYEISCAVLATGSLIM